MWYTVGMWYTFYVDHDVLPDAVDTDLERLGVEVIGDVPHVRPRAVVPARARGSDAIHVYNGTQLYKHDCISSTSTGQYNLPEKKLKKTPLKI